MQLKVKGGSDMEDIATNPFEHWMGPAFASAGARMATRGIKKSTGILAKAIRMGMSPYNIKTRF